MNKPSIPVLDIANFADDPTRFVREIGAAYQAWGFAGITNHGIPMSVIQNALRASEAFFCLGEDTKKG